MDSVISDANGLIGVQDSAVLHFCACIGAQDTEKQVEIRSKLVSNEKLGSVLENASSLLQGGGFVGGDAPNGDDEKLLKGLNGVFGIALKQEDREKFEKLNKWFVACMERNVGGDDLHYLGKERIGGQIDLFPNSYKVRELADRANALNSGVKKKKTQRQKEKEMKHKVPTIPKASDKFQFDGIPIETSLDEKIEKLLQAFKKIGIESEPEVIRHPAAQTMAELPDEIRSKPGFLCKNLFLKAKKPRKGVENDSLIWLICVPENAKVDLKVLTKNLGYKGEFRQTSPEVLTELLGVKPGSVTPFGLINDHECKVNVILDQDMLTPPQNMLWFHPLLNEATIGISGMDLLNFISATARKPQLVQFPRVAAASVEKEEKEEKLQPLELSHDEARDRLWNRLKELDVIPYKEENPNLEVKKPLGHSSHNLFVKAKKTNKLYLISVRQNAKTNLKEIAKLLKEKELRLTNLKPEYFCQEKGCITLLSLYNNVQGTITPVIDSKLFNETSLRICAGCSDPVDHSQHNVVDISPEHIQLLLNESNTPQPVLVETELNEE